MIRASFITSPAFFYFSKAEMFNAVNHNLEQAARAVFMSWFVDFKPWGGKMPSEWNNGVLSDICSYRTEKKLTSELSLQTYISTENMSPNRSGFVDAVSLPSTLYATKCCPGDILVSNIRPYFKKLTYCFFDGGCSNDVLCLASKDSVLSAYLYFVLYDDSFFDFMVAGSKGTKMPRGDKKQIMNYPIVTATEKLHEEFAELVFPMLNQISVHRSDSKKLSTLRDVLLPRLMSGDVAIGS